MMFDNGITQRAYKKVAEGERIRIAFLFQAASFWPSWESLYYACLADARFDVRLYLVDDDVDQSKQLQTAKAFLEENALPYCDFLISGFEAFSPHVAVLQTPYDILQRKPHLYSLRLQRSGIRVVYIPYGIEIADTKAARHDHFREAVLKNAWRIYTLSDAFAIEYKKYCPNYGAVRALGLPRFDSFAGRGRFMLPLGVAEKAMGRKIVVWHTHFAKAIDTPKGKRQVTPYLEEYIEFARRLKDFNDFFFIFLPHPRFGDDAVNLELNKKSDVVLGMVASAENAFVDRADDYRGSLLNADAIITDRSALMIESAVVGVPVLYMSNSEYTEPIFPPLSALMESYYQGSRADDICSFMRMLRSEKDERKALRESAADEYLPYLDGNCGNRIAEDIRNSVHRDTAPQQVKRVAIFGTGFQYKKLTSFYDFARSCEIVALSDNNPSKWHTKIDGVPCVPPSELNTVDFEKVIIMAGNVFEEEIYRQLRFDLEIPESKIEFCEYLTVLAEEARIS